MRDILLVSTLVLAFAALVTVHVAIAFGLLRGSPRWWGLVALVTPAAPYLAWKRGMRVRAGMWAAAAALYLATRAGAAL